MHLKVFPISFSCSIPSGLVNAASLGLEKTSPLVNVEVVQVLALLDGPVAIIAVDK